MVISDLFKWVCANLVSVLVLWFYECPGVRHTHTHTHQALTAVCEHLIYGLFSDKQILHSGTGL